MALLTDSIIIKKKFVFLMMLFLYFSSLSSTLISTTKVLLAISIFLAIYIHRFYRVPYRIYFYTISFLIVYFIGQYWYHTTLFSPIGIIRYSIYFLIASYFSIIYKKTFLIYFEKGMFIFAVISLVMFSVQLLSFSTVYNIMFSVSDTFHLQLEGYEGSSNYVHAIVYSINNLASDDQYRNCGFTFEPGYFSALLSFALYYLIILKEFKFTLRLIIYIIALITTLSTTGMLMMAVIITNYLVKVKGLRRIYIFPIALSLILLIASLPFVTDKLKKTILDRQELERSMQIAQDNKGLNISLGRFTGLLYHIDETYNRAPIFGFLGLKDKSSVNNMGSANGIGYLIYYFGFLGLVLFLFLAYLSSSYLMFNSSNRKNRVFFFILIIISLFAFPYINSFLFWAFIAYGITIKENKTVSVRSRLEKARAHIQYPNKV